MKHLHKATFHADAKALAFGGHSQISDEECHCGAIRLPGVTRWTETVSVPPGMLTAREAERYLSISRTTRSRLLASGVLHGSKLHVEDKHGRTEWHFAQAELDRLKQLHKPPSWRSLMRGHDA